MDDVTGGWALHQRQHSTRCCIAGGQVLWSQLYSVSTIWKYWLHDPGYALRDEFRSVEVFYTELDLIKCHKLPDYCRILQAELLSIKRAAELLSRRGLKKCSRVFRTTHWHGFTLVMGCRAQRQRGGWTDSPKKAPFRKLCRESGSNFSWN